MSEQYKRNPNAKCAVCGKPVYRRPLELKRSGGKAFCGMECYGVSNRKEIPCVVCSKPIMSGLNKITCSRSCSNAHRAGIKYKIGRPKDKVVLERRLKIRLLELRGKKCERCGYGRHEILQVHHKNRNHNDNDMNNLELICPNCHYEEHYLEKSWLKNY